MPKPIRPLDQAKILGLIEVSRRKRPATTWLRHGQIINVYTGEVERADVILYEDRIAYVGEKAPLTDSNTVEIDASSYVLAPGYIEPHAHPFQLYNVQAFSEFALSLGTTTLISDNLIFYLNMGREEYDYLFDYCSSLPIKNFWWTRLDPQSTQPEMLAKFTEGNLLKWLEHDRVLQAGELTSWPNLLAGDESMLNGIVMTRNLGKRIEGHNPGASVDTLNAMAALGVTACHEAINAQEVMRRLRLGMYATLRHSSIRPDLPEIFSGLKEIGFDFNSAAASRLMVTTDGSMPPFHRSGCVDYLIQLALESGVPALTAYRMATLNPAVYYGLDQEIGGIAPGRIADIVFLENVHQPKPLSVMADGRMVAEKGKLTEQWPLCDWDRMNFNPMKKSWRLQRESLDLNLDTTEIPVLEMVNAAIIKRSDVILPETGLNTKDLEGYCYVSLIDQFGNWITNGIIKGFADRLDALATTYTASQDVLVVGQCKDSMVEAVNDLLSRGGGIVLKEGNQDLFHLDLPLSGKMSLLDMHDLMAETSNLVDMLKVRGHRHIDPLYTLFFLSATHLPDLRLTAQGLYSIKEGRPLYPARRL
ncbi:adenine deaminase C-terminal domain-containing protein [Ammoniphilus sp. CFH 90114]|uniref:adenine deaminase C-terminal domain-containing protein n=1 Tax=Ammoniphilus sp. CFH 90114 TaxID=2493665 RepID=UPI0013E91839|nr:adenine deaminase C-terminal domain-containing protein [Ammoniphilus sp. CFH 90114]